MQNQIENQTNSADKFDTPVLLIIFNRVDQTKRVFEAIRKARPSQLFIAADGYRPDRAGEKELCELTKQAVANVDWPCEVHTDYMTENIGPCKRVPAAISWFFSHVEQGIILEDDCLPDQSFFTFCQDLLEKYKGDPKIMNISGSNFQDEIMRGNASYYFSRYAMTWGWATWRRAWKLYDEKCSHFPEFVKDRKIEAILPNKKERKYWLAFFEKLYTGKFIFWDSTWLFTIWNNDAVSIIPNKNLVQNIGFGADATHTKEDTGLSVPLEPITVITHPDKVVVDQDADRLYFKKLCETTFLKKLRYKIREYFS
jgi:hypothetical protein